MRMKDTKPEVLAKLKGMQAIKARVFLIDLAAELGISEQAVKMWKRVPKKRVDQVAKLTGLSKKQITSE